MIRGGKTNSTRRVMVAIGNRQLVVLVISRNCL